ncbi:MAG: hypothetical protein Q4B56_06250, partial [Erysipelotrichaceae bacterium]|nr:hypothetical protein [Erysipelotrichaceae bacterium]
MKKFISLFVAGLMSLSLVACGSSSDNTYVYSSELDIKNLDSSDADDGCSFTAMHAIIDGLMTLDVDGVFVNLKLCHFQWKFQLKI